MDSGEGRGLARSRTTTRDLEPDVADALAACERKIEEALDGAWHALKKIHDDKLYKVAGYSTFEQYAENRWGYSKTRAYQLIDHAKIMERLKSEGVEILPSGEGLTRPLQKLRRISKSEDDFMQRASLAWEMAKDSAPKVMDVPQVTAQHVESSMQHFGLYRNAKRVNPNAAATELRDLLTKIGQSDAMKMTPAAFVKQFEAKGFPSTFPRIVDWLVKCAEIADFSD